MKFVGLCRPSQALGFVGREEGERLRDFRPQKLLGRPDHRVPGSAVRRGATQVQSYPEQRQPRFMAILLCFF